MMTARPSLLFVFLLPLFLTQRALAQDLVDSYRALCRASREWYIQTRGYSSDEIPLHAGLLSSNACDYLEGTDLGALIDHDPQTFWHSDWHGQVVGEHYLQIALPEPLSGSIGVYVRRRLTQNHHVTCMRLLASPDGTDWQDKGTIHLGHAASGMEYTSSPVSLGTDAYRYLRFVIEENSGGGRFGHFAEFHLLRMNVFGPNRLIDLGQVGVRLQELAARGLSLPDGEVTEQLLQELQAAHDAFGAELAHLQQGGLPSFLVPYSDLPSLYINTYDGDGIDSKESWEYAKMWRLEKGTVEVFDSLMIRGRGNSTWTLDKKPYRVKFSDKQRFLGKEGANAKNWTLLANYADKTLLRNATAGCIGRLLGQPFVPAAVFADLSLNQTYLGNYQISDQVEIRKKRVNIVEQEEELTDTSDISGGYLMELDGFADSEPVYFHTTRGVPVTIKSPDSDVIVPRQTDYITAYMNRFESRLFASDYQDPQQGYRPMVDSLTLGSWFLATEYTGNPDGYWSVYLYKDRGDDRLFWGPLWDHDISFNNCIRLGDVTDHLMLDVGFSAGKAREWIQRMYADPWFRNLTGRIWHRAVHEGLVNRTVAYVDSMASVIARSQELDARLWPLDRRVYDEITLYSTYAEGVQYLKTFLRRHADFLCRTFPNPEGLSPAPAPAGNPLGIEEHTYYYIYNVGNGHPLDVTGQQHTQVCTWSPDESRAMTQQWQLIPVGEQAYRLLSRQSNLAVTDVAVQGTGGYNTGARIQLQEVDEQNPRQPWTFVPAGAHYAVVNCATQLAWNNTGGSAQDGNAVISWTNNADNTTKPTRQWYVLRAEADGVVPLPEEQDYRIVYDPAARQVSVRRAHGSEPVEGSMVLSDMEGRVLASGPMSQPLHLGTFPHGMYILRWQTATGSRALKFLKRE